jgi:signal peptidase I
MGKKKQQGNRKTDGQTPSKPKAKTEAAPTGFGPWLWSWVKTLAIAFLLWYVLQALIIKSFRIDSGSMEPTMYEGDWLFINRAVYGSKVPLLGIPTPKFGDPNAGDLIVLRGVEEPVLAIVKRVIGVAGDTLELRSDSLYRNGRYVPESYTQHVNPAAAMDAQQQVRTKQWQQPHLTDAVDAESYWPTLRTWGPMVVPAGHLFLMGDNRDASYDGRHWGFLPRENVMGRPMFIYYSFNPKHWRPLPFLTAIRWGRLFRAPW